MDMVWDWEICIWKSSQKSNCKDVCVNNVFPRLQVVSTSSNIAVVEKEEHRGFPSFSKYTVSAVDPQAALTASVSISSPSYGQALLIPVTLIHVADPSAAMQGQFMCSLVFLYFVNARAGSIRLSISQQLLRALTAFYDPLTAFCQQPQLLWLAWRAATPSTASLTAIR